jgi:hypothetical protein
MSTVVTVKLSDLPWLRQEHHGARVTNGDAGCQRKPFPLVARERNNRIDLGQGSCHDEHFSSKECPEPNHE